MDKLTGKALEAFLIFLVEHFRKYRKDYNQFSDEQIIAKFKRRHMIDQAGVLAAFLSKHDEEFISDEEEVVKRMTEDIEEFNTNFNAQVNS